MADIEMVKVEVKPGDVRLVRSDEVAAFRTLHGLDPEAAEAESAEAEPVVETATLVTSETAARTKPTGRKRG